MNRNELANAFRGTLYATVHQSGHTQFKTTVNILGGDSRKIPTITEEFKSHNGLLDRLKRRRVCYLAIGPQLSQTVQLLPICFCGPQMHFTMRTHTHTHKLKGSTVDYGQNFPQAIISVCY